MTAARFVNGLVIKVRSSSHHIPVANRSYIKAVFTGERDYALTPLWLKRHHKSLISSMQKMQAWGHIHGCSKCTSDNALSHYLRAHYYAESKREMESAATSIYERIMELHAPCG